MHSSRKITLNDGAGARATQRFIEKEILSRFGNPILNVLEDGSLITLGKTQLIVTTDTYVIDPPIFPGGDIGCLSIAGTVNDLLASGAVPCYLTMGLVVAEGFSYKKLCQILDSASSTAKEAGVQIIAGDTKVVGREMDSIYINTTGIGIPNRPDRNYAVSKAQIGDKIIVTGSIADHGFSILSFREGLGFEQRIQSDCAPLQGLLLPILNQFDSIRCLRDPTRGGLENTLLDIAENSQKDLLLCKKLIPIKAEVAYGCEMLGINPLQLVNEGKMVIVVGAKESHEVLDSLKAHHLGQHAAIIGEVKSASSQMGRLLIENDGIIKNINRSEGLPIPRLC